jgi:hypothetical protein
MMMPKRKAAFFAAITRCCGSSSRLARKRNSPPLWDVVAARLDEEYRRRDAVAPMLDLLDQIRERVNDETWGLIVDRGLRLAFRRARREVVSGIEIGLELGVDHGRASALVEAEEVSGNAATILVARLAGLLGDTEARHFDVLLALVAALRATVMAVRSEQADG